MPAFRGGASAPVEGTGSKSSGSVPGVAGWVWSTIVPLLIAEGQEHRWYISDVRLSGMRYESFQHTDGAMFLPNSGLFLVSSFAQGEITRWQQVQTTLELKSSD